LIQLDYRNSNYRLNRRAQVHTAHLPQRLPGRFLDNSEGKALKEQYQWEARSQWKGKPLEGDIEVSITLYFGTKRRADLDNFNKLSLDALTGIAYEDDSQISKLTIARAYDKAFSRIQIAVNGLQNPKSEQPFINLF
jgi:Holliday junction resolvase RusA-like endonuclease